MASRQRFGLPVGATVVGNAGWLIPRKRFDVFLQTAASIHRQRPDVRFLIAGNGPDRQQLETLSHALAINQAVVWVDWVDDIRAVYASLDLLLFNSDWDALPCTPIEAIVHGIPVVSSMLHSGIPEILRPQVDLVLLDRHDVAALSAAALHLLSDPVSAAARANQARERVLALSDPEQLAAWHERALTPDVTR
jgi:glycosyltransferase involved in cell wall biosynthesis